MEEQQEQQEQTNTENKKRGWVLTVFLLLMIIANPFSAYVYLAFPETVQQANPAMTLPLLYFMGGMSVLNVVFAFAIWEWRKFGVYGIYATVAIAFCINIYAELPIHQAILGLFGGLIIFLTTKSRWHHFS